MFGECWFNSERYQTRDSAMRDGAKELSCGPCEFSGEHENLWMESSVASRISCSLQVQFLFENFLLWSLPPYLVVRYFELKNCTYRRHSAAINPLHKLSNEAGRVDLIAHRDPVRERHPTMLGIGH